MNIHPTRPATDPGGISARPFWWLCLCVFLVHAFYLECVAEDAFISFRYARNLADGFGLVFNPNEAPVEGYTNFLWVLCCAVAYLLGFSVPLTAQVLGVLAGLGTLILTRRFALKHLGATEAQALVPCALLAVSGPFAAWSASGMETMFFAFLLLASVDAFCTWRAANEDASLLPTVSFCVLATLTRPEGLFFSLALGLMAIIHVARTGARVRQLTLSILLYAVPIGLYVLWRHQYFGYWLPNTYHAKTGGGVAQVFRGLNYIGYFALYFGLPIAPLVLIAGYRSRARGIPFPARLCLGLGVAYLIYVVMVGGDYMAMFRFVAPVLPLLYLPLAGVVPIKMGRPTWVALLCIALFGTLIHSTPLEEKLYEKAPLQHGNWRGIQTERWHVARLTLLGQFFERHRKAPEDTLATGAIGAVSWYSGLRIQGLHGLTDTHIAHTSSHSSAGTGLPGHEKGDFSYVLAKRPAFFMFTRQFVKERPPFPRFGNAEVDRVFNKDYDLVTTPMTDTVNGESGYFAFFERKGRQSK